MAGPRHDHSRDEFLTLVTDAAEVLARQEGLRGLGLRRLANAIGYAPNSLYNGVGDLDDIILQVNARTIERLRRHLGQAAPPDLEPGAAVIALAQAYLDFVMADPKLWSLLFEHVLPDARPLPSHLSKALAETIGLVDAALAPLIVDAGEREKAVAALWAALHGIASLATSGKLAAVSADDPRDLARLLVATFLDGFRLRQPSGRS